MSSRLLVAVSSLALTAGVLGVTSSTATARSDARAGARADVWTQTASWLTSDPESLAAAPNGDVWVVTQGGTTINRFTSSGTQVSTAPVAGFLALDIDVDPAGDVHQVLYDPKDPSGYVAVVGPDATTRRTYVVPAPSTVHSDDEFEPDGIALDAAGNATLFESDVRVGWHDEFRARYDTAGQRVWKTGGDGGGALSEQTDIAAAPDGTTFVLDQTDEQVHVYNAAGAETGVWGQLGTEPGRLYFSSGLAVSPWGTVFVTDRTNRVQEFSTSGAYLGVVTTSSSRNGGVDFGPAGELYVWSDDTFDNQVRKFVRGPASVPPPTTPTTPEPGATTASLDKRTLLVKKGKARLALRCVGPAGSSCAGRVVITGRAGAGKKSVALGRAAYAVGVGRGEVKVKLTKAGRRAMAKRRTVTVKVALTPRKGEKTTARAKLVRR